MMRPGTATRSEGCWKRTRQSSDGCDRRYTTIVMHRSERTDLNRHRMRKMLRSITEVSQESQIAGSDGQIARFVNETFTFR